MDPAVAHHPTHLLAQRLGGQALRLCAVGHLLPQHRLQRAEPARQRGQGARAHSACAVKVSRPQPVEGAPAKKHSNNLTQPLANRLAKATSSSFVQELRIY
jgi:hypothetical protein